MADLQRWTFYDTVTTETYTFEINPNDGGTPAYVKHVTYVNTTAPDGKALMFEGAREAQVLEFAGTILYETQMTAMRTWWDKEHQLLLTDDLGRQFHIIITDFTPKRVRNAQRPWKHTFTVKATVIDWPAP